MYRSEQTAAVPGLCRCVFRRGSSPISSDSNSACPRLSIDQVIMPPESSPEELEGKGVLPSSLADVSHSTSFCTAQADSVHTGPTWTGHFHLTRGHLEGDAATLRLTVNDREQLIRLIAS
jgi:hypothetical protein